MTVLLPAGSVMVVVHAVPVSEWAYVQEPPLGGPGASGVFRVSVGVEPSAHVICPVLPAE